MERRRQIHRKREALRETLSVLRVLPFETACVTRASVLYVIHVPLSIRFCLGFVSVSFFLVVVVIVFTFFLLKLAVLRVLPFFNVIHLPLIPTQPENVTKR